MNTKIAWDKIWAIIIQIFNFFGNKYILAMGSIHQEFFSFRSDVDNSAETTFDWNYLCGVQKSKSSMECAVHSLNLGKTTVLIV